MSFSVNASRIQVYYPTGKTRSAEVIKDIFVQKYNIPEQLISLKEVKKCKQLDGRYLEICIELDTDFKVIPNKNMELIKSSFSIFYKGFKNAI